MSVATPSEWINDCTILLTRAGSRAYGLATPSSDTDYRGVCVPPARYYYGLSTFEQYGSSDPDDVVVYELRKYMRLAAGANPNSWDCLWCSDSDVVVWSNAGQQLRDNRELFLSKRAAVTYGGYAYGELRKVRAAVVEGGLPARAAKNASHLLRLLRTGLEVLRTGVVQVKRPDAEYLLAVKLGQVPMDDVLAEAERLRTELDVAAAQSLLPDQPDHDAIDALCCSIVESCLHASSRRLSSR